MGNYEKYEIAIANLNLFKSNCEPGGNEAVIAVHSATPRSWRTLIPQFLWRVGSLHICNWILILKFVFSILSHPSCTKRLPNVDSSCMLNEYTWSDRVQTNLPVGSIYQRKAGTQKQRLSMPFLGFSIGLCSVQLLTWKLLKVKL